MVFTSIMKESCKFTKMTEKRDTLIHTGSDNSNSSDSPATITRLCKKRRQVSWKRDMVSWSGGKNGYPSPIHHYRRNSLKCSAAALANLPNEILMLDDDEASIQSLSMLAVERKEDAMEADVMLICQNCFAFESDISFRIEEEGSGDLDNANCD